jgi:hypothetical protein
MARRLAGSVRLQPRGDKEPQPIAQQRPAERALVRRNDRVRRVESVRSLVGRGRPPVVTVQGRTE